MLVGEFATGLSDDREVFQKLFPLGFGQDRENFALEGEGEFPDLGEFPFSRREQANAMGSPVTLVAERCAL